MEGQKSILIIDDDMDIRFVLKTSLEKNNFATEEATNTLGALERIKSKKPDVILLDIAMLETGEGSLNSKLKKNLETERIPIVVITAKENFKDFLDIDNELNVVAYLEKPFPISILITKLKEILMENFEKYCIKIL